MPLEGHWQRQHTPLRMPTTRAGRAVAAAAAAAGLAALILLAYVVIASSESRGRAAGCVDVTAASSTGGARIHACGRQAEHLCAGAGRDTPLGRALTP
ncbi:MAG: hypothetical protein QOK25_1021, partial [Thermoleophilaceae bacterium]|nr:hypothetical protein [Thermoleophilaceae bacterium]